MHQLQEYGKLFPGTEVTVRFNPGTGKNHKVCAALEPGHRGHPAAAGTISPSHHPGHRRRLAQVGDIVDTGADGCNFIKLNTGWTELMRPALYASQHPIAVLSDNPEQKEYVVIGHSCESGDLLTPDPHDPERVPTRTLPVPSIGDIVLIGGCGAYCASMTAHGYNGFPHAKEVMLDRTAE